MSTAILISGHMRSFDVCLPTLHHHVFRHFPDADFYVSTVQDEDAHKVELLKKKYGDRVKAVNIEKEQPVFPLPPECPPNWRGPQSFYMHEPYAISVSPQAVIGQLWQLKNAWKLVPSDDHYGTFVRCRPDLWFHHFDKPLEYSHVAYTPWWGRFGGCNDRFAVLGLQAARHYFTTFDKLNELVADGCPLHPESLVKFSLEKNMCLVSDNMDALFSTVRTNGEMRRPEIAQWDIARVGGGMLTN